MANTEYYKGQTIDPDEQGRFLKIEGEKYYYERDDEKYIFKQDGGKYLCSKKQFWAFNSINLGRLIIDDNPKTEILKKERKRHIIKLGEGVAEWNKWRNKEPYIRPILYNLGRNKEECAKIDFGDLRDINFSNANLINSDLSKANLTNANFHEANLGGSILQEAILEKANFCRSDFYKTDLSGANLTEANLQGAQLAGTILKKATIKNCKVYGSSAWDIDLSEATQDGLDIIYKKEGDENEYTNLIVEDIRMAQFIYFILNNRNLFNVFENTYSSVVLLLGRFKTRKEVLEKIRKEFRDKRKNYVPVLFDFEKPKDHDYTEIITVLAGISKFIIADLTDATSVPHELQAIVGRFRTPLVPIIHSSDKDEQRPYSMFVDNLKYDWVHRVIGYASDEILFKHFDELISTAEDFWGQIMAKRPEEKNQIIQIEKLNK